MLTELIKSIMTWIPGCSPELPDTWQRALLQAFTCFLRLCVSVLLIYAVVRLAIEATH